MVDYNRSHLVRIISRLLVLRLTPEHNLGKLYPKLVKEWHLTKNKGLTPFQVTPGMGKKVWWKCNQGHEWEATVYSRTGSESGCPYCSGHRVGKENNLAVKYPELAREWHPIKNGDLTPFNVTTRNSRKVWWVCKQGHEWKTAIAHRTSGSGCPYCWGRYPKEENNLLVKYPDTARDWHPTKNGDLTPDQVTPGSYRKVWWICGQGHEWSTNVYHRTGQGSGCPYCAGKYPTEENNLLAKYPQITKEWHPTKNGELMPKDVTPASHRKVWWVCSESHKWKARVADRTRGHGCRKCYDERKGKWQSLHPYFQA